MPRKPKKGLGAGLTPARRKSIYRRDGYACALCGRADGLQIHHVVHRSQGGPDEPWNLITLCPMCHQLAHGERPIYVGYEYLRDFGWTPEEIRQNIIEYLTDLYADQFKLWTEEGPIHYRDVRKKIFNADRTPAPESEPEADDTPPCDPYTHYWPEEPEPGPEIKPLEREW